MPQPKRFTDEELRARKNARSKQRYIENKERIAAYHAEMYQKKKVADPQFLLKQAERARARRAADPDAARQAQALARSKHADRRRADVRAWFANNPEKRRVYEANRRARKKAAGGVLSPNIGARLMRLQRGKCACCKTALSAVSTNLDHIIPLALGGANVDSNVQLLCQPCNNRKYSKHPVDFMQANGYLL